MVEPTINGMMMVTIDVGSERLLGMLHASYITAELDEFVRVTMDGDRIVRVQGLVGGKRG